MGMGLTRPVGEVGEAELRGEGERLPLFSTGLRERLRRSELLLFSSEEILLWKLGENGLCTSGGTGNPSPRGGIDGGIGGGGLRSLRLRSVGVTESESRRPKLRCSPADVSWSPGEEGGSEVEEEDFFLSPPPPPTMESMENPSCFLPAVLPGPFSAAAAAAAATVAAALDVGWCRTDMASAARVIAAATADPRATEGASRARAGRCVASSLAS